MEKAATKFKLVEYFDTKVLHSIEVPELIFRDRLRVLQSKHVKID